ncbi:MAG: WD40 repeat domain-containing protein [Scytonematopsis contorta HA4267-MV1]|jgi:hypothetical protein|nr:WD40 repeat domain-containing protein [Scytonematopsis contorta HA4267-MV1]
MQQGLTLLLQLVLELAPVIATLAQKKIPPTLAIAAQELPKEIQRIIQTASSSSEVVNSSGDFEEQKLLQQQLAYYDRQTKLKVSEHERETALKLPEVDKILDNWPLRLFPSQILESHINHTRTPLKIFLAPPQIKFDQFDDRHEGVSEVEIMLAEGLRDFLNHNYSLHNSTRPTEFLAGAWESKRFHSESSIKALFGMLKTEPILILESETDGDFLNFRIAYWGIGQNNYYYKTISRLPYKEIVYDSAKSRALEWRKIRDELLMLGEDLEEINKIGGDNVENLAILEKEEKWQFQGIDISKLSLSYHVNRQDIERLSQVLVTCHCLVAGWIADIYHLVHHDVRPFLPELLPSLIKEDLDLQSVKAIANGYQQVYDALEAERCYWVPEMALQLAHSLSSLPDTTWAQEQIDYSLNTWLQLRQVSLQQGFNPLAAMQHAVRIEDEEYVEKLRGYFAVIGDTQSLAYVEEISQAIINLKQQRKLTYAYVKHCLTGHSGIVTSIAISNDGETLVSGCADKTIKVWNLQTGILIRTLSGEVGEVSSVAVSPNGDLLAVGSSAHPKSNVKVWNLATGKLLHTLLGHQKPVNCIAISPDGLILASGSNKIKIWNLEKGDRICTLWHSSPVHDAAISPDGTILVSASSDQKIRLWNPKSGEPLRTLCGHTGEVTTVAISQDGLTLVSGSTDKTIKIWELDTGKVRQTLIGHDLDIKSIALSPNGEILVSGSADQTVRIWHLDTGELLHVLTGHSAGVNSVAFSPDGKFIASGSSDKTINIWQLA